MSKKISVIITAAGSSSRMNMKQNKIFLDIDGKPVIKWAVDAFHTFKEIEEIIIVTKKEFFPIMKLIFEGYNKPIKLVEGGSTREESTFNGIKKVSDDSDYIICHDGARPLVSKDIILNVIKELDNCDAIITGVKSKDTIKQVSTENYVLKTFDRRSLFNIQTPQAFKKDVIIISYKKFFNEKFFVTDDSSILEFFGIPVKVIEGSYSNLKITTDEDIFIARELVKRGVL